MEGTAKLPDIFHRKAMFAWVVNHQTMSPIKTELSREGQNIVVSKPLYKGKMIQILETAVRGKNLGMLSRISSTTNEGNGEEITGGNGEEIRGSIASYSASKHQTFRKCSFEFNSRCPGESSSRTEDLIHTMFRERHQIGSSCRDQPCSSTNSSGNQNRTLEGLRILLAGDTPLIQIVACKILEKVGATVNVVPDGLQAVEALNRMLAAESSRRRSLLQGSPSETPDTP